MAETLNISIIADKISNDIFNVFHWKAIHQHEANFECVLEHHQTATGKKKLTHPGDVVFHYIDPYLAKRVYLHTDLKSYSKSSIKKKRIREAIQSLALTLECAKVSSSWRKKFSQDDGEASEIRGLLFVANHDNKAPGTFDELLGGMSKTNLSIAKSDVIHVLGPSAISDLFSVATDIKLAIANKKLSPLYRFFYPDLTLWKRHVTDDARAGATIETLMSPYFILRHEVVRDEKDTSIVLERAGSLVYYSRAGETVEEFIYLLDSLLRYQLVNAKEQVRVRVFNRNKSSNIKNNFEQAKEKYCKSWGFEGDREAEIKAITIDSIAQISPNYCPDEIGWRDE